MITTSQFWQCIYHTLAQSIPDILHTSCSFKSKGEEGGGVERKARDNCLTVHTTCIYHHTLLATSRRPDMSAAIMHRQAEIHLGRLHGPHHITSPCQSVPPPWSRRRHDSMLKEIRLSYYYYFDGNGRKNLESFETLWIFRMSSDGIGPARLILGLWTGGREGRFAGGNLNWRKRTFCCGRAILLGCCYRY